MPDHDNGLTEKHLESFETVLELVERLKPGDRLIIEAHEPEPGKATLTAKLKSRS